VRKTGSVGGAVEVHCTLVLKLIPVQNAGLAGVGTNSTFGLRMVISRFLSPMLGTEKYCLEARNVETVGDFDAMYPSVINLDLEDEGTNSLDRKATADATHCSCCLVQSQVLKVILGWRQSTRSMVVNPTLEGIGIKTCLYGIMQGRSAVCDVGCQNSRSQDNQCTTDKYLDGCKSLEDLEEPDVMAGEGWTGRDGSRWRGRLLPLLLLADTRWMVLVTSTVATTKARLLAL
jgi:hypothetical protein